MDAERFSALVDDLEKVVHQHIPEHGDAGRKLELISAQRDAAITINEIDEYLLVGWTEDADDG